MDKALIKNALRWFYRNQTYWYTWWHFPMPLVHLIYKAPTVFHPREKKLFKTPLAEDVGMREVGAPSKSWWNSTTGWRVNANLVDLSYIINASNMHSIAWYCMALYGIVWYWYFTALHGIVDPSYIINASTTSNPHSFNMLWLRNSSYMKIMCLYKKTNCKEKKDTRIQNYVGSKLNLQHCSDTGWL